MKNLLPFCFFTLILWNMIQAQGTCISVMPAVCEGDCVNVTYVGPHPPTAIYSWTSTCGTFANPNQQQPGLHCFNFPGLCTLQVIVIPPGTAPDTCTVFVEVSPAPDGEITDDTEICLPQCATLTVNFFSGTPPFIYQVDDGSSITFYTSSGFTDNIIVCPLATTTYTLAAITDGSNCTTTGPFNSVTVLVQQGVTATVTQIGNMLCANPPNLNYEWWDCGYNQILSTAQCVPFTQNVCYCTIVSSNGPVICSDTVCSEYFFCELTCDIVFDDSLCVGDSVIFAYVGNASPNAIFNWVIDLPGFPGLHFFGNDTVILNYDQAGCYNVSVTVNDGNCMVTCSDSVCVFNPTSEASLCCDVTACDTCATLSVSLFGASPWTIFISDGSTTDTISGVTTSPFLYTVCPPQDTSITYILLQVLDGIGLCPAFLGNDSATVTLYSTPMTSVTQTGNTLCANPNNLSYAWYDCGFNSLVSTSQCMTITQSGCYCLIVDNGFCQDTVCMDYVFTPCELTCFIAVEDSVCIGDTVIFAYVGNASANAIFNWAIDLPGFPGAHFTGVDTVIIVYDTSGCYYATVTVMDGACMVTCSDSVCVFTPKSEASICCDVEKCDSCTTLSITLAGAAPWTAYISDGTNVDTIAGILTSPYLYMVCPPGDSTVTYTLLEVTDSCNVCPAVLSGDTSATVTLHHYPVASIVNNNGTLCAFPLNMAGYGWYFCPSGSYLSISQCFTPTISGCYCVDVSTAFDCVDTACFDLIVGINDLNVDSKISVFPNPSLGELQIYLSHDLILPVHWEIYDQWGLNHGKGVISDYTSSLLLNELLPSGLYFLKINTRDDQIYMIKVMLE